MDRGLQEQMKKIKIKIKRNEKKIEKIKRLMGYLRKKKEWKGLKVFWIIKEVWWI